MTEIARVKLEEKEKYQREVQNIRKQVCVTYMMVSYYSIIIASLLMKNNHFLLGLTMSCNIIRLMAIQNPERESNLTLCEW